ncbi:hypothetical protein LO767_04130 [Halopseudomonas aestusnigri]|uniref:hypothetical protein n=1 Tax=Halopseudomonas aestusnigri TaxID=857252 RepID=UPI001E458CD5|nr:hypothetical protein [Halopseudomonas aestusnigri]UGV31695.1 hypothetical protein LO767_04130 [Halopseudomonas aestusnigri]
MESRHFKHLDFAEIFQELPLISQGRLEEAKFPSIPSQFVEDFLFRVEWIAEASVPGIVLRPPPDADSAGIYHTNFPMLKGQHTPPQWDDSDAYGDIETAAAHFVLLLDSYLDDAWEILRCALTDESELSRSASSERCGRLQIFHAIQDRFPTNEVTLDEELMIDALLIYQYDTLFGLLHDGLTDDALYVMEDIALLRSVTERIFVTRLSEMRQQRHKSENARDLARLRHEETNSQRAQAIKDWDANGTNVSSMAAFARARHRDFGVTERTLYTWIRDHQRTKTQ